MITPYIDLKNVFYSVEGNSIIKDINLSIHKDDFIAIIGGNGCGKTTLTKLLLGILKKDAGEIIVDGKNIEKYKLHEIGAKIGYVFQNPSYQIFAPTVEEELSFAMRYKDLDEDVIQEKVQAAIKQFSLEDAKDATTYNLSQGEKRRLAIGCMLLNNPEFIILDEPTVGLDEKRKKQLFDELSNINKKGIGIIIVTHDRETAKEYVKRSILIKDGKIYENI